MVTGHKTAIKRNKLSAPMQWLIDNRDAVLHEDSRVLDFGCGRGEDADIMGYEKYDPHWFPDEPSGLFDVIICSYVLCVLPPEEQAEVIKKIQSMLEHDGIAFISARRDIKWLQDGNGCRQRRVILNRDPVYEKAGSFAMWEINNHQLYLALGPIDVNGLKSEMERLNP